MAGVHLSQDWFMTDVNESAEWASVRALHDAIQVHPGTLARRAWDALRLVHMAFLGNQAALLALVQAIESNDQDFGYLMAGNVRPEEERQTLYAELFRHLHNYVSSAVTLIDHTRNLTKNYKDTSTHAEYQVRIAAIRAGGLGPFVAKLRVYVVHVGVPSIGTQIRMDRADDGDQVTTITSFIDRDRALDWPDWSADAREYLSAQPEHIPFRDVVTEYGQVVEDLYRWFYDQFPVLHGADIEAANALIKQMPGGGRPPR